MTGLSSDGAISDVGTILQTARGLGESSWRVGIALGVEPAELERIERELDRLGSREPLGPIAQPGGAGVRPRPLGPSDASP